MKLYTWFGVIFQMKLYTWFGVIFQMKLYTWFGVIFQINCFSILKGQPLCDLQWKVVILNVLCLKSSAASKVMPHQVLYR